MARANAAVNGYAGVSDSLTGSWETHAIGTLESVALVEPTG